MMVLNIPSDQFPSYATVFGQTYQLLVKENQEQSIC